MAAPVSFIVPLYNAQNTLLETLQSIAGLNTKRPLDIWIIDDGSSDRSVEIAGQWIQQQNDTDNHISAALLHIDHGGEAAAMNAGLEKAASPFIAWVESDVKLDPQWLNHLLSEFKEDKVAGAGGLLLPADDDPAIAKIFGYEIAHKIRSNKADALHITSANALYRKAVFDELGPCRLDLGESSFDSEYNHRIRAAGYRLRCNPNAVAWHHFKTRLVECMIRTFWYGFRRPYVQSQVLYPFDRWIALLVLGTGIIIPALTMMPAFPMIAAALCLLPVLAHLIYSIFLYCHFPNSVLLWSSPIFLLRNVVFLFAYLSGWIVKWLAPKTT